ncbi:hypothetical protein FHS42_001000 [Streptomyces zagrosensis]|uniref:Uncharacterized protein n=1 Tax=Streptomyces zagrosensis TaxID=1042984 RepID=A0A7W9UXQ4_9ACTN|nr:hypothetical protein [Streptomyces zagrosensis]
MNTRDLRGFAIQRALSDPRTTVVGSSHQSECHPESPGHSGGPEAFGDFGAHRCRRCRASLTLTVTSCLTVLPKPRRFPLYYPVCPVYPVASEDFGRFEGVPRGVLATPRRWDAAASSERC